MISINYKEIEKCEECIECITEEQFTIETVIFGQRVNRIEKKEGNSGTRTGEVAVLRWM